MKSLSNKTTLLLHDFLPYRLAVLAKTVGICLSKAYEEKFGITNQQWRTMFSIARKANCSASYVVKHAALDKVQVSRALAGLIEMGLVKRKSSNSDRRNSVLKLTKKGWQIYEQIVPKALEFEAALIGSLDDKEANYLHTILSKLADKTNEL
tara:strand:+ start:97 stop:552 length:456 start_codon:yes stop_codon:yes gene_type:complete